jgi:hypothetical protein
MATNPYAAPQARVADAASPFASDENFVPEGRAVDAGRGWNWVVEGWHLFRASPWVWIGIAVALLVVYAVVNILPFGQVAFMLLTPPIGAGLLLGCRALEEGRALAFGTVLDGFRLPQTFAATVALLAVAIGLISATVGLAALDFGSGAMMVGVVVILLVIAASVPIYMALWFAPALVTFHDYTAGDALKASFRACLRNVLPFLVYGVVVLLLGVAALIPLGLGFLVLTPVVIASVYTAYRDIYFAS